MMSIMLVGGMILSVPTMAQGSSNRHRGGDRPSVSRSESRPQVSRSESRPQVSRSESRPQVSRSESRPQVSRSENRQSVSRSESRPQVSRSESRPQVSRSESRPQVSRESRSSSDTRSQGNMRGRGFESTRPTTSPQVRNDRNSSTQMKSRTADERGRGGSVGNDRGGRDNDRGGRGNDRGGRGGNMDNGRDRGGNHGGYGPRDRGGNTRPYDYGGHPHRDQFSWNHSHHNWGRPLPPPPRPYRPAPLRYYRPVIPAHYRPYYGAPVIDRILGLTFGTLFDVSLDYLYGNGYYIDGYEDNIVYLRDVRMLNLLWPDVMLCYDNGRLANAQFVYMTNYSDRSRYNRIYHDLSAVYGPPISVDGGMATWFGGNTTGYVTLSMSTDYGRYYTTMSIGY